MPKLTRSDVDRKVADRLKTARENAAQADERGGDPAADRKVADAVVLAETWIRIRR